MTIVDESLAALKGALGSDHPKLGEIGVVRADLLRRQSRLDDARLQVRHLHSMTWGLISWFVCALILFYALCTGGCFDNVAARQSRARRDRSRRRATDARRSASRRASDDSSSSMS